MKYRAIISEAWAITQENKKLIWLYAFVPALITFLVSTVYFAYQTAAFYTTPFLNPGIPEDKHAMRMLIEFILDGLRERTSFTVVFLVIVAIVILAYLTVPVFSQGALIQILARKRAGQEVTTAKGITYGFTRFLQLFEYHLAIRSLSFVSLLGEAGFVFRNAGPEVFSFVGWVFLLALFVALVIAVLFTYAEYYIVIDNEGVFSSMVKSSGLVVRQWNHTLFMLFLMAVIVVRTGINILLALVLPLLVFGPLFFFTSSALMAVALVGGTILALGALYFASYFLGVFHVFTVGVWTFTFLDLTAEEKQDIDLHEAAVHE